MVDSLSYNQVVDKVIRHNAATSPTPSPQEPRHPPSPGVAMEEDLLGLEGGGGGSESSKAGGAGAEGEAAGSGGGGGGGGDENSGPGMAKKPSESKGEEDTPWTAASDTKGEEEGGGSREEQSPSLHEGQVSVAVAFPVAFTNHLPWGGLRY